MTLVAVAMGIVLFGKLVFDSVRQANTRIDKKLARKG